MELIHNILPGFETLTPEETERIQTNSFLVTHRKGEHIFSQDKPVSYLMYLQKGLVKVFKENQNKNTILKIVRPGNYVGLFSAFFGNRYQFSAMALDHSEIIYLSIALINEIINENGRFAMQMIQHFSRDGMEIMNKLIHFPHKQVPGRMAEVLLHFAFDIYGKDDFILPLSRQELADMVYSTKESVSRTLTEFKNDRMIDIEDRRVKLKSIDLLHILSKLG